jgi:nitrous oxidase accessory protein NosD
VYTRRVEADERVDVTVQDTEIHANEDIGTALRVAGSNTTAKNCVITTAQGQPDTAIKASGGWAVLNSEIVGKATGGGGTVKWNTFKNPGGLTWFIDGKFGHDVIGNAFIGADIRIDSNDVSVYNIDKKLGNYYSAFSKPDSNDDGIIDTARELPGDAGLVDEFPLASKDLSQYQE